MAPRLIEEVGAADQHVREAQGHLALHRVHHLGPDLGPPLKNRLAEGALLVHEVQHRG